MKTWIVRILLVFACGLFFFSSGWKDVQPDYMNLEIFSRTVSSIAVSVVVVGVLELGRWLERDE